MHAVRPRPDYQPQQTSRPLLSVVGSDVEPWREGQREADRRRAEADMARWKFRMPCSIARILAEMHAIDEQRSPMQMVANWLRLNCRGAWTLIPVPGGDVFFCLNDAQCARLVMTKFGRAGCDLGRKAA